LQKIGAFFRLGKKISLTGIGESVPNGDFSNEKNKKMQLLDLVIATAV
jgi:hypothetical protein